MPTMDTGWARMRGCPQPRGAPSAWLPPSWAWMLVFILTGIATPLLVTQARYDQQLPWFSMWPLYPLYLGNLLAGLGSGPLRTAHWRRGGILFALDLGGQSLTTIGLLVLGPPLYSILYKSVTVFTGLLAVVVLPADSHPTRTQWGAVLLITVGLLVAGRSEDDETALSADSALLGSAAMLGGCVFFAGGAVASETICAADGDGDCLAPPQAAWVVGVLGISSCALWGLLVSHPVWAVNGGVAFALLLCGLVLTNAGHQLSWFTLVGRVGACATAVLKALQSVSLFVFAAAAFCSRDGAECMTFEKALSFIIVSVGVLVYSWPKRAHPADNFAEM